mmetsp:Transcript_130808/g.279837  ORF Transcript_130808/g.279837 Transcript_130808/m.279837 type:complete len:174 (-) Transcript_130808:31-552(-)
MEAERTISLREPLLTDAQVMAVQHSWRELGRVDSPAEAEVSRFLRVAPEEMVRAIGLAVRGLNDLERTLPKLKVLGCVYAGLGLPSGQLHTVERALEEALEEGLGNAFNEELRSSWAKVFAVVMQTMSAAQEAMLSDEADWEACRSSCSAAPTEVPGSPSDLTSMPSASSIEA